MSNETMARLFELKNIAGVKDATGNVARVSQQRHIVGKDFIQLSGEDMTALAYNAAGGHGCISVVSNVAPRLCAEMQALSLKGDFVGALAVQDRLVPLHDAVFKEPGLAGAKHALKLLAHERGNPPADDAGGAGFDESRFGRRPPACRSCELIRRCTSPRISGSRIARHSSM